MHWYRNFQAACHPEQLQPIRTSRLMFWAKIPEWQLCLPTKLKHSNWAKDNGFCTKPLTRTVVHVHWWRAASAAKNEANCICLNTTIRLKSSYIPQVNTVLPGGQIKSVWARRWGWKLSAEPSIQGCSEGMTKDAPYSLGFQYKGNNASSQRGRCRGACVRLSAALVEVYRHLKTTSELLSLLRKSSLLSRVEVYCHPENVLTLNSAGKIFPAVTCRGLPSPENNVWSVISAGRILPAVIYGGLLSPENNIWTVHSAGKILSATRSARE